MPVFDVSPSELRDSLLRVRERVLALDEPRRWYSALVLAVMIRAGTLAEWRDWRVEPPRGSSVSMTPATMAAIDRMFSTSAGALLRSTQVNGIAAHMGRAPRVILDPFRQQGRGQGAVESLCLVTPERRRFDVPVTDSGWLWNLEEEGQWPAPDDTAPEYKPSGDYQQQQGIACGWPADQLFGDGTGDPEATMATPRPQCARRQHVQKPARARRDAGPPELADQWICSFNDNQCAMKEAGSPSVGGPRALVPDEAGSARLLLTPGSFERILDDANASNHPLPRIDDFALLVSYLHRGGGTALDFNRVHELIAPDHAVLLFEHREPR